MGERPRFILQLTLRDNEGFQRPIHMAVGVDESLRISSREVWMVKSGFDMSSAVDLMRQRVMRKDLFIHYAENLGALLAERMEDAEGWHDASRVEPARAELGLPGREWNE